MPAEVTWSLSGESFRPQSSETWSGRSALMRAARACISASAVSNDTPSLSRAVTPRNSLPHELASCRGVNAIGVQRSMVRLSIDVNDGGITPTIS